MNILKRKAASPIGLDIGSRTIKAVQFASSSTKHDLQASIVIDRPKLGEPMQTDEAVALRRNLRDSGFSGNHIVIAAPADRLLTAFLELPPRDAGVPLDQIAKMEFARLHRCDPKLVEVSYWDLPAPSRSNPATHVMAAGYRHQDSNELLDILESAGFYVRAIDTHSWSMLRACAPLLSQDGLTMVLDLGYTATRLVLANKQIVAYERNLTENGIDSLIKRLAVDGNTDLQTIESDLQNHRLVDPNTDDSDKTHRIVTDHYKAIADELRVSMSYAAHRYSDGELSGLLLVGGGAETPGLDKFFEQTLELNVRTVSDRDFAGLDTNKILDTSLTVAAGGLAMFAETQ